MPVNLVYIGDPLLDIAAECDADKVAAFGLRNDDWIQATAIHNALFSQLLTSPRSTFIAGGSAQNSARVAKWVLRDHGTVTFAGCVGKDEYAKKMAQILEDEGVQPIYFEIDSMPTGLCVCLTGSDGKRSLCSNLGAAGAFSLEHLRSEPLQLAMEKADAVFLTSYFIFHSPDVADSIKRYCFWCKKHFAVSLSAVFICQNNSGPLIHYLRYADIVFGTANEARAFMSAATGKEQVGIEESAKWMAELPREYLPWRRIIVISNGADPVVTCTSGQRPKTYPVPPVSSLVDTIGCGDALSAAFLSMYLLTNSVDEAVRAGIQAARLMTQTKGCRLPELVPIPEDTP